MLKRNYEKIHTLIQMYEKKLFVHHENLIEAFQDKNQESFIMNKAFVEVLEGIVIDLRQYRMDFFSKKCVHCGKDLSHVDFAEDEVMRCDSCVDIMLSMKSVLSNPVKPYSDEEYEDAKNEGLDLDDWNDYVKYFGVGEEPNKN